MCIYINIRDLIFCWFSVANHPLWAHEKPKPTFLSCQSECGRYSKIRHFIELGWKLKCYSKYMLFSSNCLIRG